MTTKTKTKTKKAPKPGGLAWPGLLGHVHELDCLEGLEAIPDAAVDLVFADPPFNIGRAYDAHDDGMALADYLAWSARWIDACVRILKPTGSLWICSSEEHVSELKVIAEGRLGLALPRLDHPLSAAVIRREQKPLKPRHHVVWYYTFGVNSPKKLTRSHTHLLHFVKSLKKHAWNEDAVRVPSAREEVYNDARKAADGRLPDDTWIIRPADPGSGFAPGDDVQHHSRVCGTFKEKRAVDNQMPEALVARIVRLCTAPGDVVVSPFCGSGTDAAVAKKLGRRFVTFEVSQAYAQQAEFRVASASEGAMLDAPDALPRKRRRKKEGA